MANAKYISSLLDSVRAEGSTEYQARVPEAVKTNISDVGNPILERTELANEFIHLLVGRIALTIVRQKIAYNPLAVLKKGSVPLGSDIQEIFTNMAQDTGFDPTGKDLLKRTLPDVKVLYHRRNRQSQYPATISRQQLATAFTSYEKMEELITGTINSMYSGDNKDEYILTKNTMASAIEQNKIVKVKVDDITSEGGAKKLVKAIINASKFMVFPSTKWNAYNLNRPDSDEGRPIETWTPLENQILIIRADIMTEINVEEIANAYNMDKVTFKSRVLEVDNFGTATDCYAIIADESWVEVRDNLFETGEFYNPQGLYWNYWLNHWQTYSLSLFANAIAFIEGSETIILDKTTLSFSSEATQTITATTTPVDATVVWISSDPSVATVENGVVTPLADGTCFISAINGDKIANCKVTVNLA